MDGLSQAEGALTFTVPDLDEDYRDKVTVPTMREFGFDTTMYADFSREGIENFINYLKKSDPDKIGDLDKYTLDQLADTMTGHGRDVFTELTYISEYVDDIDDYRERILARVRRTNH